MQTIVIRGKVYKLIVSEAGVIIEGKAHSIYFDGQSIQVESVTKGKEDLVPVTVWEASK
jgi:hypothetical protein